MKKNKNTLFIIFLCCTFFFILFSGPKMKLNSAEDFNISAGVAIGANKIGKSDMLYIITTNSKMYKEDESLENEVKSGKGSTIGETREERQKKIGKQFFLGLSKAYLLDEKYAEYGIRPVIDIVFKNPVINDNAFLAVCKGKGEEYLKHNLGRYENSGEYISDMIKNSVTFNFFTADYTIKDAMLSMDSEGKSIICPYLKISEEEIKMDGMAIFKKDKLGVVLDMNETKIMNLLRENKVKGILTIQKNSKEYVNYAAKTKRKVQCSKSGDKYTFIINLNLNGDIVNNELYKDMSGKIEVIEKFEEDMAKKVEEMCYRFLDKMKKEYKVDCLQLGWVAASKYGRDTGVDWNEIVSKSDIKVNVKVHIDKLGRGEY
ncbi:Ger(x)C family spore germination protein [Clostridium sp. P21]|uniref:Ger(X)C family spore germination protein n=1 Tax=Clostridium muellerianum TaxID=2716538 RepID=A0A7Y0HP30_9CLOT|nr:Ger(x)C family spore germination protein [Clostridium muellerianum]NMM62626.1 Ger(x)C family spore germination protein [Clostridium muellerianum]